MELTYGSSRALWWSPESVPLSKPTARPHVFRRSRSACQQAPSRRESSTKFRQDSTRSTASKQELNRPASPKTPIASPTGSMTLCRFATATAGSPQKVPNRRLSENMVGGPYMALFASSKADPQAFTAMPRFVQMHVRHQRVVG